MPDAAQEVMNCMEKGERPESIVFGNYGWGGYGEIEALIPEDKKGKVLSWKEGKQFMKGWSFNGGFGSPSCYAVYIWTNKRVLWVTQYDGSTSLCSAPRNPTDEMPVMPGG